MLRRTVLLLLTAAWLAACSRPPGGAPQPAATTATLIPHIAPTASPVAATGTPSPAPVDDTAEPPAVVEPPAATLTINGQSQTSGIGTYCWSGDSEGGAPGLCVDKAGVPTPRDPLQVATVPFTAQFAFAPDIVPTSISLTLIPVSPADEMTVDGTPDWRWWPFGQGQTFELASAATTEVGLAPEPGLYALTAFTFFEGRGDVVYGFLVQVGEVDTGTTGVAFTLPETCQPRDQLSPYVDPGGRYCLLYPAHFLVGDVTLDRASFYGPPLDQSSEPLLGALTLSVNGPAGERNLAQVVDEYVAGASEGLPVTRSPLTVAGEPAELVEGLPGRFPHWQILFLHNGLIYQVSVYPKGPEFAAAQADVDAVWNVVRASLTFFD